MGSAEVKQLQDTVLGSFWMLVGKGLCESETALGHCPFVEFLLPENEICHSGV